MKLRHLTIALLLAGGFTLSGCDQLPLNQQPAPAEKKPVDESPVVATVNGTPITENMLNTYQKQRQGRMPNDPGSHDRKALLDELINLELASQDGEKKGVDKDPEVYNKIEQQRRAVLASAAFARQMRKHPITEEELKALYKEKVSAGNEYKARHILVDSKEKAETLIAELDKGADFAELAKKHSTGPSGKNGGELGWFSPKSMVKPFAEAVTGMEKGSFTHEPVQTQFGWHIIELEDARETTPPPFEQVKPQLEMFVRNQRVQDYLAKLRKNAQVQVMLADTAPKADGAQPATAAPDTAAQTAPAESANQSAAGEPAADTAETGSAGSQTPPATP